MNTARRGHESTRTALLLLGLMTMAWLPAIAPAWRHSADLRGFLILNAAVAGIMLGLIFDSGERLLAGGKGIYTAAVACSLPAVGVAIADPGSLALLTVAAVNAFSVWLAIRARESTSHFALMFFPLLGYAGFLCGLRWEALAFAPALLLSASGPRAARRVAVALAALLAGIVIRIVLGDLHVPAFAYPTLARDPLLAALLILPWSVWAIPVIRQWPRDLPLALSAAAIILLLALSARSPAALVARTLLLLPALSLITARHFLRAFGERNERVLSGALWPQLIVAATLGLLLLAAFPGPDSGIKVSVTHAVVAAALLPLLVGTYFLRQPRWTFAALFTAALWFGAVVRHQFALPVAPTGSGALPLLAAAAALLAAVAAAFLWRRNFGAPIPASVARESTDFLYAGGDFRRYDVNPLAEWRGRPADLDLSSTSRDLSFVIFGDMAGADSMLNARHQGHLAYRELVGRLRAPGPEFAISLGDLSTSATDLPYRRLRQQLCRFPLPLLVTPGNHDIFDDTRRDLRLFHALFGPDQRSVRVGRVHLLILNNAWGSFSAEQFTWLESELAAARDADFRLVFAHKPIFDPRAHTFYGMENRDHAAQLHGLFQRYSVHAVFSGHIHALLTFARDGVTYIISGGGGSKLASPTERYHYWVAELDPQRLLLRALPLDGGSSAPLATLEFRPA